MAWMLVTNPVFSACWYAHHEFPGPYPGQGIQHLLTCPCKCHLKGLFKKPTPGSARISGWCRKSASKRLTEADKP